MFFHAPAKRMIRITAMCECEGIICVCVDKMGHQSLLRLYFILANEEAASALLGHNGNVHSEVTSKAG